MPIRNQANRLRFFAKFRRVLTKKNLHQTFFCSCFLFFYIRYIGCVTQEGCLLRSLAPCYNVRVGQRPARARGTVLKWPSGGRKVARLARAFVFTRLYSTIRQLRGIDGPHTAITGSPLGDARFTNVDVQLLKRQVSL